MSNLLNWKELSRRLAGNETSITRNRIPKKYQQKIIDLIAHVEAWQEKIKEKDDKPEPSD
jgi:hypothetical protein